MATTTPNFGWSVPTSTDLVKDGATAIETLGDAIDASLVDLKGGTTGQVLAKASATDMDFQWVAQDDSNAIQNALLTTTGDTIYASGASTPARLGIGSTGQVLTVAGGVPTWATAGGGWTLISSVTPSTSSANVSFTGISSTYRDLRVMFSARPSGSGNIQITTNAATEYSWNLVTYSNTWTSGTRFTYFQVTPTTDLVTDNAKYDITFYDANSTTKYKSGLWTGSYRTTALGSTIALFGTFATDSSSAISSITISSTGGNWAAGGTVALYGLA